MRPTNTEIGENKMVENSDVEITDFWDQEIECCTDGTCVLCADEEEHAYLPGMHVLTTEEDELERLHQELDQRNPALAHSAAFMRAIKEDDEAYEILKAELLGSETVS